MSELSRLPAIRFFFLLAALLVTVGASFQALDLAIGIWLTQLGVFLLPAIIFARACNLSASRLLRFSFRLDMRLAVLIALAAGANYLLAAGLMVLMEQVVPAHWPRIDARAVLELESGLRLAVIVAGVLIAAPLCEEAAFRGFVQQPLTARIGPWPGILVTGFLFSALHLDPVGFLSRLELGVLFGWLLWRTGSIWAPIIGHLVNNGVATLLFFATRGADIPDADTGEPVSIVALFGLILFGLVLLVPLLRLIHRMTQRQERDPEAALAPLDPSRPIGLSPRGTIVTSIALISVVFVLAMTILARSLPEPPIDMDGSSLGLPEPSRDLGRGWIAPTIEHALLAMPHSMDRLHQ